MANRAFYPSQSYGIGRVYCDFRFACAGAATSIAASTVDGADAVATITHSAGAATFIVTLKDTFNAVICAFADFIITTSAGSYVTIDQISNENTANPISFRLQTWVAAGTVFNDPSSGNTICVSLALRNAKAAQGVK
jgi:hypothetical protein